MNKARAGTSPTKIILSVFVAIILGGAILLMLPVSTAGRECADFLTALFTATSATCVTGLAVADTLSYWSRFGQTVILLLIQCGGLGFMAFATIFSLIFHRRISLRERLVMSQAISVDSMEGIVRLTKKILSRTFIAEGAGALLLSVRFIPEYGWGEGIFKSVFHSVSAFCNAGFDVIGLSSEHIGSVSKYANDPLVCLTLVALMVFGGLGFFVWEDIRRKKRFRDLTLHTKLVLITTSLLLVMGSAGFMLFEYSNGETIGNMSFPGKLLAALFQAATCRTAGFYVFSQGDMSTASKLLSVCLMFIGGSPGSTAGGVKTVTAAALVVTAVCVMRGRRDAFVFGRRLSRDTVYKCIGLFLVGMLISATGAVIIGLTNNVGAVAALFESVSAFSTTGLSTGITGGLNDVSKVCLIVLMYFGRVGLLTVSLGLLTDRKNSKLSFPEGKIMIG